MVVAWMIGAEAAAAVLHVGAGQPYGTVTGALAVAADGDLILVHDTVVNEAIVVDGLRVGIRAATRATWASAAQVDVELENGADVVFTNFDFDGGGRYAAIIVMDSTLLARRSTFGGYQEAVATGPSSSARALHSRFEENEIAMSGDTLEATTSVFVDNGVASSGYQVIEGNVVTVTGSSFARNLGGFGILKCSTCTITDSTFVANAGDAVTVVRSEGPGPMLLERNLFCDNETQHGTVYALSPVTTTLRNNAFLRNESVFGALMADGAVLEHNTILGHRSRDGSAVMDFGIDGSTFVGNLIAGTVWTGAVGPYPASTTSYGPITSSYGAWFANDGGHASSPLGPTELVGVPPMLSIAGSPCSWEYIRPLPGSPLIDADPTLLDADGTPADIGATGGPAAP